MKFTVQTRGQLTVSQKSKKTYFMVEGFAEGGETQKCICFNSTQYEDFASGKNPDVDIKPRQSGDPSIELLKEDSPREEVSTSSKTEPKSEPPKPVVAEAKDRDGLPLSVKIRTFTISYAKDLCSNGIVGQDEILSYAKAFEGYIWGYLTVKDDDVFRRAISHAKLPTFEKGD